MPGAGKYVDLGSPAHTFESNVPQDPFPLCRLQSTGHSTGPEVDVVLRALIDGNMHDHVANLEAAPGLQHAQISCITAALSGVRLMTPLLITTSIDSLSTGRLSA